MKKITRLAIIFMTITFAPFVWAKSKTASKSSSKSSSSNATNNTSSDSTASSTPSTSTPSSNASKIYSAELTTPLITLSNDTSSLLGSDKKSNELDTKITELESAWDAQEKTMKPIDETRWTAIDKTLDKAIASIRGSKFDAKKGKAALDSFVKMLTESTK